jgi:hypothetical protein
MKLSKAQVTLFWRLWSQACRAQGWDKFPREEIEVRRKELLRGCGFASLKDVDGKGGFDRVKQALLLAQDSVAAGLDNEDEQEARRLRWVVRNQVLPALGLYVEHPDAYMQRIIADKFCRGGGRELTLDDLSNSPNVRDVDGFPEVSDSDLRQIVWTLTARLDSLRTAAGHSRMEMVERIQNCHLLA